MTAQTSDINLDRFRSMKEGTVSDMEDLGTDDVCPVVEVWRDGKALMLIMAPEVDRDLALNAAHFAIRGMGADRIVMMMDAHVTKNMNNPSTGKPWGPGEMQKACDEEGACSLGLITDCLLVQDASRDGDHVIYTLPYHVNKDAKQVHWQKDDDTRIDASEDEVSGLVPETIREFFQQPLLVEEFVNAEGITIPDEALEILRGDKMRAAQDAACIARLLTSGYAFALMGDNEWVELMQEEIGRFMPQEGAPR